MTCNICGKRMDHVIKDLFRCKECELISSDLPPDKTIYDRSYCLKYERYAKTDIGNKIDMTRIKTVVDSTFTELGAKNTSILDFGCGHGSFLVGCKIRGVIANGFDINPHSFYTDISVLFNGHKIVTFWDSLEHVQKPKEIIRGLNPKFIFISTPNTDDFPGRDVDLIQWHHYYPKEHVHYFNLKSLQSLLAVCGYRETIIHYKESKYRTSGGPKNIITIGGAKIG